MERASATLRSSDPAGLVGSWSLVDCVTRLADGQVVRPFGEAPSGMLMYDAEGHMSVHLLRADEAATLAERSAGYTGYFGIYSINDGDRSVVHHLEGSSDARIGGSQVRHFRFEADRLILAGNFEGTVSELVWRRR